MMGVCSTAPGVKLSVWVVDTVFAGAGDPNPEALRGQRPTRSPLLIAATVPEPCSLPSHRSSGETRCHSLHRPRFRHAAYAVFPCRHTLLYLRSCNRFGAIMSPSIALACENVKGLQSRPFFHGSGAARLRARQVRAVIHWSLRGISFRDQRARHERCNWAVNIYLAPCHCSSHDAAEMTVSIQLRCAYLRIEQVSSPTFTRARGGVRIIALFGGGAQKRTSAGTHVCACGQARCRCLHLLMRQSCRWRPRRTVTSASGKSPDSPALHTETRAQPIPSRRPRTRPPRRCAWRLRQQSRRCAARPGDVHVSSRCSPRVGASTATHPASLISPPQAQQNQASILEVQNRLRDAKARGVKLASLAFGCSSPTLPLALLFPARLLTPGFLTGQGGRRGESPRPGEAVADGVPRRSEGAPPGGAGSKELYLLVCVAGLESLLRLDARLPWCCDPLHFPGIINKRQLNALLALRFPRR